MGATIPKLIKDFINHSNEKNYNKLSQLLSQYVERRTRENKKLSIEPDYQNIKEDILSDIIIELWKSRNNSFWKRVTGDNEDNDKLIYSYLKRIYITSVNMYIKTTKHKQEIDLYEAITQCLNDLVRRNKIIFSLKFRNKYYSVAKSNATKPFDINDVKVCRLNTLNIYRGAIKQINHKNLSLFLLEVFHNRNLEKYHFSVSNLLEIVKHFSNYEIINLDRLSEIEAEDDVMATIEDNHISYDSAIKIENFLEKFRKNYTKTKKGYKTFTEDLMITYWKLSDPEIDLKELSLKVFGNKQKFRTVSVRWKKIEKLLKPFIKGANEFLTSKLLEQIKKNYIVRTDI